MQALLILVCVLVLMIALVGVAGFLYDMGRWLLRPHVDQRGIRFSERRQKTPSVGRGRAI